MTRRVTKRDIPRHKQRLGRKRGVSKFEIERFNIGQSVELGESFEHLDARLNQLCFGSLGSKPVDKSLGLGALFSFVGAGLFMDFVLEDDLRVGFSGAAFEFADFLAMDNGSVCRDAVHEITIMGDQNKLAPEIN